MVSTINRLFENTASWQSLPMQSNRRLIPLSNEASDIISDRRGLGLSSTVTFFYKKRLLGFNCIPVMALQKIMEQCSTDRVLHGQTLTSLVFISI